MPRPREIGRVRNPCSSLRRAWLVSDVVIDCAALFDLILFDKFGSCPANVVLDDTADGLDLEDDVFDWAASISVEGTVQQRVNATRSI